jgi:hypothetical protein
MKKKLLNPHLWMMLIPIELIWIWCCTKLKGNLQILCIINTIIGILALNYIALKRTY